MQSSSLNFTFFFSPTALLMSFLRRLYWSAWNRTENITPYFIIVIININQWLVDKVDGNNTFYISEKGQYVWVKQGKELVFFSLGYIVKNCSQYSFDGNRASLWEMAILGCQNIWLDGLRNTAKYT